MKLPRVFCSQHLDRSDEHHLRRVLRMGSGDQFIVCDGEGREWLASLETQGFRLLEEREAVGEPVCELWLLVALARGERFERTLEKATELGVARITPVLTEFGVVKDPGENRRERWQRLVREAAALAGRARLPVVDQPRAFSDAVAEVDSAVRLLCTQGEPAWRGSVEGSAAVLIGPEGGFSSAELGLAKGWTRVGLGPRNLRVETAATAALTLVLSRSGDL